MEIERESDFKWLLKAEGKMRSHGVVYASDKLMEKIREDNSLQQVVNVATLPGIVGPSMAMPDIHWGYGFPIGGVAAFDESAGIVSPGGVGYDINCGVRMIVTNIESGAVKENLRELLAILFSAVPSGVGSRSRTLDLSERQMDRVIVEGAAAVVAMGYGTAHDLEFIESNGTILGARTEAASRKARERGEGQLGTLGSGNHFLELDRVAKVLEPGAALAFGLQEGRVVISIHTGSRGFGHQICDDALRMMQKASSTYGIDLPDRQLACAPLGSKEAESYLAGMAAAANFAFANRQVISHLAREALSNFFHSKGVAYEDRVLYDVAHNIAKWEKHVFEGREKKVLVHRKGATRAFGPGNPEIPAAYRQMGQPVLIPGDMGRSSYVLVGAEGAMQSTFGSTCHGAGRVMSRHKAKKTSTAAEVVRKLEEKGILVRAASRGTILEELPEAYKDVSEVVSVVKKAGIAIPVARLEPMGVMKG